MLNIARTVPTRPRWLGGTRSAMSAVYGSTATLRKNALIESTISIGTSGGNPERYRSDAAVSATPAMKYGFRRPMRVRVRSDIAPTIGCAKAPARDRSWESRPTSQIGTSGYLLRYRPAAPFKKL